MNCLTGVEFVNKRMTTLVLSEFKTLGSELNLAEIAIDERAVIDHYLKTLPIRGRKGNVAVLSGLRRTSRGFMNWKSI